MVKLWVTSATGASLHIGTRLPKSGQSSRQMLPDFGFDVQALFCLTCGVLMSTGNDAVVSRLLLRSPLMTTEETVQRSPPFACCG